MPQSRCGAGPGPDGNGKPPGRLRPGNGLRAGYVPVYAAIGRQGG